MASSHYATTFSAAHSNQYSSGTRYGGATSLIWVMGDFDRTTNNFSGAMGTDFTFGAASNVQVWEAIFHVDSLPNTTIRDIFELYTASNTNATTIRCTFSMRNVASGLQVLLDHDGGGSIVATNIAIMDTDYVGKTFHMMYTTDNVGKTGKLYLNGTQFSQATSYFSASSEQVWDGDLKLGAPAGSGFGLETYASFGGFQASSKNAAFSDADAAAQFSAVRNNNGLVTPAGCTLVCRFAPGDNTDSSSPWTDTTTNHSVTKTGTITAEQITPSWYGV